ncbi:MAG: substrate-binding domain-containing protein [Lentisphaeria bacterium]
MGQVSDKVELVRERLIYEIDAGVFKVSERLPGERTLAQKYSVSRNTVRQAFDRLEKKGIVERVACSGAYVSACALDKIVQARCNYKMDVVLLMPPDQISNPIIQNIFSIFKDEIIPEVKIDVVFVEKSDDLLAANLDADLGIVFAVSDSALLNELRQKVKQLILLNTVDKDFNYIAPDNCASGRLIAEYLIECGHRKIGGLCFDDTLPSSDFYCRMQGAKEVFDAAGIKFAPHLVSADFFVNKKKRDAIHSVIMKENFTAYIGGCDQLAIEIGLALMASGRSIPEDVSVVGFDDQFYAAFTSPPLTTVKYPIEAIGIKLAEIINQFLESGKCDLQELVVPILLKRQSVKQIRRIKE